MKLLMIWIRGWEFVLEVLMRSLRTRNLCLEVKTFKIKCNVTYSLQGKPVVVSSLGYPSCIGNDIRFDYVNSKRTT